MGSVNTAEVAVAVVSAVSLLTSLGGNGITLSLVAAMLCGGVIAAPLAAHVVRFIPARGLGLAVGGLLLTTQLRELLMADIVPVPAWVVYVVVGGLLVLAAARPHLSRWRPNQRTSPPQPLKTKGS